MADETDDTKNTGEGPKWAAYLDDNGNTYYYNSETNESSWEKPDQEFILPVEEEEQAEAAAANAATDYGEGGENFLSNSGNKEKEGEGGRTPYHISSPLEVADADAADVEESSEVEKEGNNLDEKNDRQENTTSNNNDESATWIAYKDDNGNEYFYNSVTQATQWEKPEGVTITYAQEEEEEEGEVEVQSEKQDTDSTNNLNASNMMGQEIQQQQESPNVMKDESSDTKSRTKISEEESYAMDVDIETPQQEEEKDTDKTPDTKEDQDTALVREAYDALKSTDSIFEPDCTKHLGNLVKVKGQDEIPKAMNEIVESYKGQTAICGVLSLWITDLAAASSSASFENSKISSSSSKKSKENNMDKRIMSKASSSSTKNISSKTSTTTARAACKALQDPRVTAAETIREISGEVIFKFAKDNFTKTGADSILKLVTKRSSKSSFVQKMMDSDQWRKLLIELFASNKDNPLLMGCLQTISQRGHIREISKQINPVDIFDVFNEMMVSELTIIGKIAMGGVSFLGNNNGNNNEGHNNASTSVSSSNQVMEDSISNLKEKCCSTAFTYFYAQHFIKDIIERLRGKKIMKQQGGTTPSTMSIDRAIQKYERLSEELEEELVSGGGGESHIKKRRVNLALCVSDLYKRDRKRLKPATTFTKEEKIKMSQLNAKPEERKKELSKQNLESAVMDLIKMFSEKKNIDSKILNRLLFPKNLLPDQKYSIGELLIAHPSSVKALYSSLFQYQGGASTQQMSNIKSPELRQDCAKLLAKAVIASKESFHHLDDHQRSSNNNTNKNDEKEEIRLWRMFLKASQICNKIENLVSFTVRDYKENLPPEIPLDVSIGGEISYLAIKSAPVAQGLLLWISEISSSPEFEAGAVYSTMAPSILSLVRLIAKYHPFTRPTVLKIALVFLKHNNNQSEMGYERIKSLKEKIFRLLLWLSALGLGLEVYGEVERMLTTDKSNEIDPPLLRYLLIGTLDIIQISPPDDNTATSAIGNNHHHLSIPFIKLLSRILSTKASMDAILSPHFPSIKKIQLQHLLSIFSRILSKEKQKASSSSSFLSEDDIELVKVLQNIYAQ